MDLMYVKHVSFLYCSIFGNEKRHSGNKSPWKPVRKWAGDIISVVPGTVIEYPDIQSQLSCYTLF